MSHLTKFALLACAMTATLIFNLAKGSDSPEIRTPKAPATPRINGPDIFGVRPDHPFLYHIPATGQRPMGFSVDGLPAGLTLFPTTGNILGELHKTGNYVVVFHAKNSLGAAD